MHNCMQSHRHSRGSATMTFAVTISHLSPEAEDIKPGASKTIAIKLSRGRYVFLCNLKDHYERGMHTVVTVR